jgi:phosphinothricin acetyltransferase
VEVLIRKLDAKDWKAISEIYKQGIETGDATFETTVPSWDEWDEVLLERRSKISGI